MIVTRSEKPDENSIKIFFSLNYSGETVERMPKSCIKKLYRSFKLLVFILFKVLKIMIKFFTFCKTTNMSFFANTEDKILS